MPILATRGCPYQCTYCASPNMWTTKWYAREPKDVVDEMQAVDKEKYGAVELPLPGPDSDPQARLDHRRSATSSRTRDLGITWQFPSGTRCEVIDDEVARLLHETGGSSLALALRRAAASARGKLIKKRMKTDALLNACQGIGASNKLNVTAFIVIGFPHDTPEEDLEDTK